MTREELDFIGSMNMCDEISNEAYKKIVCHCGEQEPCKDAISRQAALDCFTATKLKKFDFILYARKEIKKLPSVNPQPKTGHWIEKPLIVNGKINGAQIQCSECLNEIRCPQYRYENLYEYEKYCSSCGAKMIDPQESEETDADSNKS